MLILGMNQHILVCSDVPIEKIDALMELYNSTNGDSWYNNANWGMGDPCINSWHGIICDDNDDVWIVDLGNNNLHGNLTSLSALADSVIAVYFYYNNITGIPSSAFHGLTNVTDIRFNANQVPELHAMIFSGLTSL